MNKQEQIKDMAQIICGRNKDDICILDKTSCDNTCSWTMDAKALYDAGYRKADEVRKQAVKEFAEKLRKKVISLNVWEFGEIDVIDVDDIDELLKEYEI